ncbi:hypothetical protein LZC95_19140 [Pendulispora brunnea]|uniref:Uncharacterized protein n=1 Tax=Pendulispora brunnea TaxID=2905690 RepID=A0ABZ2KJT0_9BACT
MNAVRKTMLALLAAAFGVACNVILGVDDLPRMRADGSDAQLDHDASNGGGAGRLDSSFGDRGIATITMSAPLFQPALIVEGDAIRILATTADGELVLVRCSNDGSCDTSHPTILWKGRDITGFAVKDPTGGDLLIHMSTTVGEYHTIVQLLRLERDGGVEVLQREEYSNVVSVSDHGVVASPSRIVMVQSADLGPDGGQIQLRALLPDGGVDPHFGANGLAVSPIFAGVPLLTGSNMEQAGEVFVLFDDTQRRVSRWMRFLADGGRDTTFGSDGGIGESSALSESEPLLADDAGYVIGARSSAVLVHVTRDGRVDLSRWDRGVFRFPSIASSDEQPFVVGVNGLGRGPKESVVVLASAHRLDGLRFLVLVRVGPDGLDRRFGNDGIVILGSGADAKPNTLAMQSDGKALVIWEQPNGSLKLARYIVE